MKSGALLNIVCQQVTKFANIFSGIQFSNSTVTSNIITTKKEEDKCATTPFPMLCAKNQY